MGLDITALRQARFLGTSEEHDSNIYAYVNNDFPGRADGVEVGYYTAEEVFSFGAGSYSGYNMWREQLAKLAGYGPSAAEKEYHQHSETAWAASGGPFWELINFSDCEGTIGGPVVKKLLEDFQAYQSKAAAEGGYFYERYQEWMRAFSLAVDSGLVVFH